MNNLATTQAEAPVQAESPAYHHPALQARYLKELTAAWMRSKHYNKIVKIIIARVDRLKLDPGQETLGDCVAYYMMIGSTPPIIDLEQARSLRKTLEVDRPFNPFFDFEGEESLLAFVEATVREHIPQDFKRVQDEHLARLAAAEANTDALPNSGTFTIGS